MKTTYKKVERVLPPVASNWVGNGFRVHNFFPSGYKISREMSPFYLLDYNSKIDLSGSEKPRGVGVHPHKGFETVTIAYRGVIAHEDSFGNKGIIRDGGVQWMTAGAGILHKEFHEENFQKSGGPFQMVQLWVNLPAKDKNSPPSYQDISHEDKGVFESSDGKAKVFVIAGDFEGVKGPATTFTRIDLLDIVLQRGGELTIPVDSLSNTGILVVEGQIKVNREKEAPQDHFVLFNSKGEGDTVKLFASEDSRILFLDGDPINEPIAQYGPFLMNNMEEIQEAMMEFRKGKYGHLE